MKIKVFTLAWDDDDGTGSQAFATEAERDAALAERISPPEDDKSKEAEEMRTLLKAGNVVDAYRIFQDHYSYFDTYNWDEDEIEVPPPADLLKALQDLTEWGRTHTSPLDKNSPHQLLIAAVTALEKYAPTNPNASIPQAFPQGRWGGGAI
jgi:hypothetical protein